MKLSKKNQLGISARGSIKGFTLIEVIVVMAIIVGLAGIGFGVFFKINETAKSKETETIINAVASAMEARAADISSEQRASVGVQTGRTFPNGDNTAGSTEVLVSYISGDFNEDGEIDVDAKTKLPEVSPGEFGKSSYLDKDGRIVDSWGTPLRYRFPGDYHNEDDGFDLESAGPDREFGSGSDDLAKDNIILK